MNEGGGELVKTSGFIGHPYTNKTKRRPGRRQLNVLGTVRRHIRKTSLLGGLLAVGVGLALAGENLFGDQAGVLADRGLDLA